jgi:glycosyltransferase involved in cell wall biosynthesis
MTISVIIPAHNAEATLAETLASVVTQTLPPDEIIIVDDGSTDRTAKIAASAHASVRVVCQANRGAAAALNAGLRLAVGDEIAFIDADDLWAKEKLSTQKLVLTERPDLDGVGSYIRTFLCATNDAETNKSYRLPEGPEPCWLLGALLLRRRCFERCPSFEQSLWVGYSIDWFDRALGTGLTFAMVPNVLLHRRIRPGSLSHRSAKGDQSMVELARRAIERRRKGGLPQ